MMYSNLKRIVVWTALALLAGTGTASARVVNKFTFKGKIAAVRCTHTEQIECPFGFFGTIQTTVFVNGEEIVVNEGSGQETHNNLFALFIRSNSCTSEETAAFGALPGASSQQSLQSAELQGDVPLVDYITEEPAGTLSVDLSFDGFGDTVRDKFRDHFQFEFPDGSNVKFVSRRDGKQRSANVTGTLSFNGTPLTCTLEAGTLEDINSGSRQLEHF